jgi:hypothetical protein
MRDIQRRIATGKKPEEVAIPLVKQSATEERKEKGLLLTTTTGKRRFVVTA